jgi:hypothetical protein
MVKGLIFLTIALAAFQLYAFVECAMRDDALIKRLPKWGWLLIIFFLQAIGAIAYFVAGRKPRGGGPGKKKGPQRRILPPDDDPDFLRKL